MKKIFSRIEFWIVLFFLIRLTGITNPPLEIGHNWRQVTGLMVSRNFLETDANIFYPRVDVTNGKTGVIGMEFPVMNYLYFLTAKTFGYTHWYGRLINLIISSLGLFFFYRLICHFGYKHKVAFAATIFLAASIWFAFSRKMMPDTFCISLVITSLFFGVKFLDNKKISYVLLFGLVSTLAVLSKIPAGIYFVVLIPLLFSRKYSVKSRIILASVCLLPLFFTYYWYFVWNPYLAVEFSHWYNIGKPVTVGFIEVTQNFGKTFKNFYFNAFSGYFVFVVFSVGLLLMAINKEKKMIKVFLLFLAVFVLYIFKSGFYFYHHSYYIIPFVPVMAFVAGYAVSRVRRKWLFLTILVLGAVEGIANQQHDFFIKGSEKYKMSLESIMDKVSEKNDLIVINGNENPQLIYLSHRKGWNCNNQQLQDKSYIQEIIGQGCKYIVINRHTQEAIAMSYKKVFENEDFLIYKTTEKQSL